MIRSVSGAGLWRGFSRLLAQAGGQCTVCWQLPSALVCADCQADFGQAMPRCTRCAIALPPGQLVAGGTSCAPCQTGSGEMNRAVAAFGYAYPWRDLLHRYKFEGDVALAPELAQMMLERPGVQTLTQMAPLWVPIPALRSRLVHRGFDQAVHLAQALQRLCGNSQGPAPKLVVDALLRNPAEPARDEAQSKLNKAERMRRMRHAFVVNPERSGVLKGQHVLLLDDVMTTGATLQAAARTLRAAGADQVSGLVFARTD